MSGEDARRLRVLPPDPDEQAVADGAEEQCQREAREAETDAEEERGDPIARFIVERGQTGIALVLDHLVKLGAKRICMMGGLGRAYQRYLPERFAPNFAEPLHDALDGAILLAGGRIAA